MQGSSPLSPWRAQRFLSCFALPPYLPVRLPLPEVALVAGRGGGAGGMRAAINASVRRNRRACWQSTQPLRWAESSASDAFSSSSSRNRLSSFNVSEQSAMGCSVFLIGDESVGGGVPIQRFLQGFSSPMQARHYGAHGNVEDLRNLLITETFHVGKEDG